MQVKKKNLIRSYLWLPPWHSQFWFPFHIDKREKEEKWKNKRNTGYYKNTKPHIWQQQHLSTAPIVTKTQRGQSPAGPYHLLNSMTVTQNAAKREAPQHRLEVLSCWFVNQQWSVCGSRLKVVSRCGETIALWQATPTLSRAPVWNIRETLRTGCGVSALTTAFENMNT